MPLCWLQVIGVDCLGQSLLPAIIELAEDKQVASLPFWFSAYDPLQPRTKRASVSLFIALLPLYASSFSFSAQWSSRVSFLHKSWGYVTQFAPQKAFKLIS